MPYQCGSVSSASKWRALIADVTWCTPVNWIAADIVLIKDNVLVEHWDVIQDEASREQSKSGRPMFGTEFP
jgi:predicted SnoaL-like aldol condensation-catalyzing enzyme